MKKLSALLIGVILAGPGLAQGADELEHIEIELTLGDKFIIAETLTRRIDESKVRDSYAKVDLEEYPDKVYEIRLYFKRDTREDGRYDTAEKLEKELRQDCRKVLDNMVETDLVIEPVQIRGRDGFYTQLTKKKYADLDLADVPAGSQKFLTKGMVRLSDDAVLEFELETNMLNEGVYEEQFAYILDLIKEKKNDQDEGRSRKPEAEEK